MSRPVPALVRGVLYPSIRAAAESLGLAYFTVWLAIEEGREATVGQRDKITLRRPCLINGKRFNSRTEAARAIGVSIPAVSQAVKEGRGFIKAKVKS